MNPVSSTPPGIIPTLPSATNPAPELPPGLTPTLPSTTSPVSELPPGIIPTLPSYANSSSTVNSSSKLILPGQPLPPGSERTDSGLIVVRNRLSQVATGSKLIIATSPLTNDTALDAAKAAHAELTATHGAAAADLMYGAKIALAQRVRSDELQRQAVAALMAGDLTRAVELIQQSR